jgi:hypothetical protein
MASSTSGREEGDIRGKWLIYAFMTHGTMVLAEYTEFTGNHTIQLHIEIIGGGGLNPQAAKDQCYGMNLNALTGI